MGVDVGVNLIQVLSVARDDLLVPVEGVLAASVDLPFEPNTFDVVTAFETIYFWPDAAKGLAEIHRVLKPGGRVLVCYDDEGTTPGAQDIAKQIEGMSLYTAERLESLLSEAGFVQVETHADGQGRLCAMGTK